MLQLTKNFALEKKYIQGDQTLLNGIIYIYFFMNLILKIPQRLEIFFELKKYVLTRTVGFYEL